VQLEDIKLNGYGHFSRRKKGSFIIDTPNLPESWEFIYQTKNILLKVDQAGPVMAQAYPPKDIVLFKRGPVQRFSSWLTWFNSDSFTNGPFTNFFRPNFQKQPDMKPQQFNINYAPDCATYTFINEGLKISTKIFIPADQTAVCITTAITNQNKSTLNLSALPAVRTYVNPAFLNPWDNPEWYLRTSLIRENQYGILTRLYNMNSIKEKRRTAVLWVEGPGLDSAELSYERFCGQGSLEKPAALFQPSLSLSLDKAASFGTITEYNNHFGYPPVNAFKHKLRLKPGKTATLKQVMYMFPPDPEGGLPDKKAVVKSQKYLDDKKCSAELKLIDEIFNSVFNKRRLETPEPDLNHFVNEWLAMQLHWAGMLTYPFSTVRGCRDAANHYTAAIPLSPTACRDNIALMLECQRTDGWFPRQYSPDGRHGQHDLREHVDAGNWIIEECYEYLCFSKDFSFLDKKIPWLNSDKASSVVEHLIQALEWFTTAQHTGEHGLCKIGEGDWLDSVNRAGIRGRGESVMVTGQTVISLQYMTAIINKLELLGKYNKQKAAAFIKKAEKKIELFRKNLRRHAYNKAGYFNSVFNDDGCWLFSDKDPDGEKRFYGPANWYAISCGAADQNMTASVFKHLSATKTEAGYRMMWPPMGAKPIANVGRGGSGDVPAGLWENGTVYNQGSHGFLGRALAVAGEGDMLYDVLRYMLPFDQRRHPVSKTLSPPYAMVNCWQEIPGFRHRGGLKFLTGSIAMAARMAYEWLSGVKPALGGLTIDPCLPAKFKKTTVYFPYNKTRVKLTILNPGGHQCGVKDMTVNKSEVKERINDPFSKRQVPLAKDDLFNQPLNEIKVTLGQ